MATHVRRVAEDRVEVVLSDTIDVVLHEPEGITFERHGEPVALPYKTALKVVEGLARHVAGEFYGGGGD